MESLHAAIHPHDIDDASLRMALAAARRPDLLRELVDTSRRAFGFFTGHHPHTINYPWVIERLENLPSGARVLDVGAGVSPVPLVLASHGFRLETVDSHRTVRELPSNDSWNEWGFFDYAAVSKAIVSHHCAGADLKPGQPFDAIYSVSVLAHMRQDVRKETLARCREWLKPGGRLLLAIDLIPSSDFLWNRCEGQAVEPLFQHGTIEDLRTFLAAMGFAVTLDVIRCVPRSRTDLLFVDAKLS